MNKEGWNHLSIKGVGLLCTANHRAQRHLLMVKEEVTHQRGFARAAAPNKNHHGILGNLLHVKLLQ
jgi:hypothetical protein